MPSMEQRLVREVDAQNSSLRPPERTRRQVGQKGVFCGRPEDGTVSASRLAVLFTCLPLAGLSSSLLEPSVVAGGL